MISHFLKLEATFPEVVCLWTRILKLLFFLPQYCHITTAPHRKYPVLVAGGEA